MLYEDFELLATDVQVVKEESKKRTTFQVRVVRSPSGKTIAGIPGEYDTREMRDRLKDWEHRALDWPDVMQVGHWLGCALFPSSVRDLLVCSLDLVQAHEKGLRVRLLLDGTLYNVPWEYALVNRGGGEATVADFLGLMPNISIVRHQAAALPAWNVQATLPAQMVVALASPEGPAPLKLDEERKVIEQALGGNPRIKATFVPDATPQTFLSDARPVHLFHFAGHGSFEQQMGAQLETVEGKGVLVLDDGAGDPALLSANQLALELRQAGVRVAVLGACQSGRRDDMNVWSSVAAALLKVGLGAVVGMQYTVRDSSAIVFADAFYKALVAGLPIDEAVTGGRVAIARQDAWGWGVPVLYLRAADGVIFPEYLTDASLEPGRKQLRVEAHQRVTTLRGNLVGVRIETMGEGNIKATQVIGTVGAGGQVTGAEIGQVGGGEVESDQTADTVEGNMVGVSIGSLGGGSYIAGDQIININQGGSPARKDAESASDPGQHTAIYDALNTYFSKSDLEDICFRLGVEWDDLKGETLSEKARAMIKHFAQRSKLDDLLNIMRQERPNIKL